MTRIGSIYVEVRGDYRQYAQDMRQLKQFAKKSGEEVSDALANAISPRQASAGIASLSRNLTQLATVAKAPASSFKATANAIAADLTHIAEKAGLSEKEFAKLNERMLQQKAYKGAENSLRQIARAADLSEKEIRQLAKQMGYSSAEADKMTKAITRQHGSIGLLGKAWQSLSGFIIAGVSALATYKLAQFTRDTIAAASNLEEVASKFAVVFKGQEAVAEAWVTTLVSGYAMSTREAKQYLASVQDLLVPMGMAADAAGLMSNEVVKLAADLGSFNNMPTARVIDDIQSALVGNYETMKKYGVVLNATVVQEKALAMGLAETKKELTAAHKAQAAYKLMLEGSAAAIGDMARTSDSYANQVKALKAGLEDLQVVLGTKLLPTMTKLVGVTADVVDWFSILAGGETALTKHAEATERLYQAWRIYNATIAYAKKHNIEHADAIERAKRGVDEASIALGRAAVFYKETADSTKDVNKELDKMRVNHAELDDYMARAEHWDEVMAGYGYAVGAAADEMERLNKAASKLATEHLKPIEESEAPAWVNVIWTTTTDTTIEQGAKRSIDKMEEVYRGFLERVQTSWADTFDRIFEGTLDSWTDVLNEMGSLLRRFGSELIAMNLMGMIMPSQQTGGTTTAGTASSAATTAGAGAAGWLGGPWGIAAGVGLGVVGGMLGGIGGKDNERRQQIAAWYRELRELDETVEDLIGDTSDLEKALRDANELFDRRKELMESLGYSTVMLMHNEEQRIEVLRKLEQEYREAFEKPLRDIIAQYTMTSAGYERYGLDQWYKDQIVQARELGAETVKLLRQAYELQKAQTYMAGYEALSQMVEDYEDAIAMLDMTPIEQAIYQLEKAHADALATMGEEADLIAQLDSDIAQLNRDLADLDATTQQLSTALNNAQNLEEQRYQQALNAIKANKNLVATLEYWGKSMDEVATDLKNDAEAAYYYIAGFAEGFEADEVIAALDRYLLAIDAAADAQAEYNQHLAAMPGEIDAINAAIADLQAQRALLTEGLTAAQEAELQAYLAQKQKLQRDVAESWADIIRKHTMTAQELEQYELDAWYEEQLKSAQALGLSIDDLNRAYNLQKQAIWDVTDAADDLTDSLDRTLQSIEDMIAELTGGRYAPVQSMEWYQTRYQELLSAGDVDRFLAFIPEYLDFMKSFGADYAALTASVIADLEALKASIQAPGAQWGGLTQGLTWAGERGPEWIIPTYEPERSHLLSTLGIEPDRIGESIFEYLTPFLQTAIPQGPYFSADINADKIGQAIANRLAPFMTENNDGRCIHIHLNIDGRSIQDIIMRAIANRSYELVEGARRIVQ